MSRCSYLDAMRDHLFTAAMLIGGASSAQVTFERTYGGPEADLGFSVQQTMDGGYALFGVTWNTGGNGADMYLVKTDASGATLWEHTYGGIDANMGYGAQETSDGGFILCGMFGGFGTDTLTLVRTDAAGEALWTRGYRGALGRDIGYSVLQTSDGGFAVCGFMENGDEAEDVFVVRTDAEGDTLWTSAVDLGGSEAGWCIRGTDDEGFIVVANSFTFADPDGEIHLIRFNADGDTLWTRTYAAPGPDESHGLWMTSDGGFIIADGNGYPSRDIMLIRTDAAGVELWRRVHATAGDEMPLDIEETEGGGFICAGRKEDPLTGHIRMHLLRTDADGFMEWERTFPRGIFSEAQALDRTTDGGYVLLGQTADTLVGQAMTDLFLVKTDGAGYSGIGAAVDVVPSISVFPNPCATDVLHVRIPDGARADLLLLDATGRVVRRAVNATLANGSSGWDLGGLPTGAYELVVTGAVWSRRAPVIIAQ